MWLPRAKSTVRVRARPSNFSCSSFKDIQHLCSEDFTNAQLQAANSPRVPSVFHRVRRANSLLRTWSTRQPAQCVDVSPSAEPNVSTETGPSISLPGTEKRVVVYFTSLRVIRSTFEDCRAVRSILRSFRVSMDERDLAMDTRFMEELQGIWGNHKMTKLTLPRVFIGGRYVGGAEEIRQLHEAGELKKFVEGLPAADAGVCEVCGGYRFILCDECRGSHKCYSEKGGFRTCTACNENGLIRCPTCLCAPL
ncbi:NAD(P)-binding Rossmann-fold superfamily protein [Actinidia rufa]|uniref:NAD(P)-binding Rossmann-fold superfamily protein n=1 Tax=Actinidia rufa TaxID=165716 RepID=A0A7J0FLT0_9ERIC|nr:NAD(P)-binding Rossmann-fold superfamily protein [Actinidia rufa]